MKTANLIFFSIICIGVFTLGAVESYLETPSVGMKTINNDTSSIKYTELGVLEKKGKLFKLYLVNNLETNEETIDTIPVDEKLVFPQP